MALTHILIVYSFIFAGILWLNSSVDFKLEQISRESIISSHLESFSQLSLAIIRAAFAGTIWFAIFSITTDSKGFVATVFTKDGFKEINLKYLSRITAFTVWSFILQGIYFTLGAYIYFAQADSARLNTLILILFEVSYPVSFLVSSVVVYVLIPTAKKKNLDASGFFRIWPCLMHNANVIFMTFEMIFNRLPINLCHLQYGVLWGIVYTIFAWVLYKYKGFYYYFFLDYNRPSAVLWYIGLTVLLSIYYLITYGMSLLLKSSSNVTINLLPIVLCALVMKFSDKSLSSKSTSSSKSE